MDTFAYGRLDAAWARAMALDSGNGTGAVRLPVGTTAQRPSPTTRGELRFNSANLQPEISDTNAATPLPIGTRIARASTTGAARAYDVTGFGSSSVVMLQDVYSGATPVSGQALLDWNSTSLLADDSSTVLRPNSITAPSPGRWIKRTEAGVVPVEQCGALGDYVFPTAGVGEVLGTDNTSGLSAACSAVGYNAALHKGGVAQLQAKCYRVTGTLVMPPGSTLRGNMVFPQALSNGFRFGIGSIIVLDGPNARIQMNQGAVLEGVKIYRRGMDLTPTSAMTNAYWDARVDEAYGTRQWKPNTAYAAGAIVVSYNQVYICDTAGTSGAANSGGPRSLRTTVNAITDGTATWHWYNQYSWYRGKPAKVGSLIASGNNIYQYDTAGTTSASGAGPTATTAGVGSITDGSATCHWIAACGCAITTLDYCTLRNVGIVGFARGVFTLTGMHMDRVWIDAIHCVDMCNSGDIQVFNSVLCRAQYQAPGDIRRRHGVGIYLHDRVDTIILRACGAQLWGIGFCLENCWPQLTDCGIESDETTNGDTCIQLLGIITGAMFHHCYFGGVIAWHIAATNLVSNPNPAPGWTTSTSQIEIVGGWFGAIPAAAGVGAGMWPNCVFYVEGQARVAVRDGIINQQGQPIFVAPATTSLNQYFWSVRDMTVLGVNPIEFTDFAILDPSVAANWHFDNILHGDTNRYIVQPGHNDTADVVTTPVSAGSRQIPNATAWCHLANAGTLASYTLTLPTQPIDKQVLEISAGAAITALTITPAAGHTVAGAPTTIAANGNIRLRFRAATSQWQVMGAAVSGAFLPLAGGTVTGPAIFSGGLTTTTALLTLGSGLGATPIDITMGNTSNVRFNLAQSTNILTFQQGGTPAFRINGTATAPANYIAVTPSIAGSPVAIAAAGTDANIILNINGLGTGGVRIQGPVAFNNNTPGAKPAITGSRAANAALADLLTKLATYGLITDSTSA